MEFAALAQRAPLTRTRAGSAARCARRRKGPDRHYRHADGLRLADLRRTSAGVGCAVRGTHACGRRHRAGQDGDNGICDVHPNKTRNPHNPRIRPADRRRGRRPRSPTSWCRSRSARRPRAPSSGRRLIAAWSAINRVSALISRVGVKVLSDTLDTVGTLARSVPDAAYLAAAVSGRRQLIIEQPWSGKLRIGICRDLRMEARAARNRCRAGVRCRQARRRGRAGQRNKTAAEVREPRAGAVRHHVFRRGAVARARTSRPRRIAEQKPARAARRRPCDHPRTLRCGANARAQLPAHTGRRIRRLRCAAGAECARRVPRGST